jgi:uncharacterized protein YaiE (UPF0345 family)
MSQFDNISVLKRANVFFGGKCISHTVLFPDGSRKSVGVILPGSLTFRTTSPEVMECVAGACRVKVQGESQWKHCGAGESFEVPAESGFDIEVTGEPYHYVCHFG